VRQRPAPAPEAAFEAVRRELQRAQENADTSRNALFRVLTQLIDRQEKAGGHARRVAARAAQLASALPAGTIHVQSLALAALFHDLGKAVVAPAAGQDDHACAGQALLAEFDFLQQIALWVRHHHERYDGTGTPDGLRGEAIPLGARILAIANDYDELLHGTLPGCEALSAPAALRFLESQRGRRYDPALVDAFLQSAAAAAR